MKRLYKVKQLLHFRKELCRLCFENIIFGDMINAEFEIDILNIIQEDYLERPPFESAADFLLRYNHKSSEIIEETIVDYPEKKLCDKINSYIEDTKEFCISDFKRDFEQYKKRLREILPEPIISHPAEAILRRFLIIYENFYTPLESEQCRQISNLFS